MWLHKSEIRFPGICQMLAKSGNWTLKKVTGQSWSLVWFSGRDQTVCSEAKVLCVTRKPVSSQLGG